MPGVSAEYARLPVTESVELTSDEDDDLYTRPPRRQRGKADRGSKAGDQAMPSSFREAATRPVARSGQAKAGRRYQLLDEEDALGVLQAATPDVRVRAVMSTSRKLCLVLTCLLMLTGCSMAIWLLPCRWYGCQRGQLRMQQSSVHRDYETLFPNIVVTTRLVVAPTVYLDSIDLVFGFRREGASGGGIMVIDSSSSSQLWSQELYETPVDLQCGSVDLNGNGIFECLATGSTSMVALINMDKHEVEWYLHTHNSTDRPLSLVRPVLLRDLTQDGVADLLVAGLLRQDAGGRGQPPHTQLMLVDGATGMVLSQGPVPVPHCPVLLSMVADDDLSDITLECMSQQTGVSDETVSLSVLTEALITPAMSGVVESFSSAATQQEQEQEEYQIQVENFGVCPECRGRLMLVDGSGSVLWDTKADRARVHSAHQFSHRNHTGLVYKLWQYPPAQTGRAPGPGQQSPGDARPRRWVPAPEEEPVPTLVFEEIASVTQSARGIVFSYQHPGSDVHPPTTARPPATPTDDGSTPEFFTESVHVVWPDGQGSLQTRQVDAVQVTRFCRHNTCQPAALPDNTVTAEVLDVGGDLDLDLATVTSTYVAEGDVAAPRHRYQCSLQTRLRKVQLYGPHWRETLPPAAPPV